MMIFMIIIIIAIITQFLLKIINIWQSHDWCKDILKLNCSPNQTNNGANSSLVSISVFGEKATIFYWPHENGMNFKSLISHTYIRRLKLIENKPKIWKNGRPLIIKIFLWDSIIDHNDVSLRSTPCHSHQF